MHYLCFALTLTLFALPVFAVDPEPERKLTNPPNYGEFVGVKPSAYEESGVPHDGIAHVNLHPGVVIGGPDGQGKYQVAMISNKIPHNPPQKPIKDFHPTATTYGNVALSPPKGVGMEHMRHWLAPITKVEETPLTQQNLHKLKTEMIPHVGWRAPTPPPRPPHLLTHRPLKKNAGKGPSTGSRPPPAQGASSNHQHQHNSQGPRFKNAIAGSSTQGGSSAYPRPQGSNPRHPIPPNRQRGGGGGPRPPYVQGGSRSTGPAANVASSSKHTSGNGSQNWRKPGPPPPGRPNSPSKRPNSPSKRPSSPSKNSGPGPSSRRPYPPPSRPHSPTDRSRAQGPQTHTQHTGNSSGKGKGRAEGSPKRSKTPEPQTQTHSKGKGKGREGSPSRKSRFN